MSTAFIFPGQGSQSIGMMNALAESSKIVQETFAEASAVLGYDLWELVTDGPSEKLNLTEYTQPAILTAGVATWRTWLEAGGTVPGLMAGHSLGEYTAVVCAGAMSFTDAVSVVSDRAHFMQQAVPEGEGAMAAILGLDDDDVRKLCEENASGEVLQAVNYNAPGQVVVAGSTSAVGRLVDNARAAGAKRALQLPVSVPSHSILMQPASDRMSERLKEVKISRGQVTVIHNVNLQTASDEEEVRQLLARQISAPVRWVEMINSLNEKGVTRLVECGPGKVLCGLSKRINRDMSCTPLITKDSIASVLEAE